LAKSSTITRSASSNAGAPSSAVIATVGVRLASRSRRRRTSVVVPLRVIATTASYRRPNGNSEAANASASPFPEASRRAA
jgi:hypothetical protein